MPLIGTRTTASKSAEYHSAEPLDPAAWIPLTELALEGFGHADTIDARVANLRHELADEILFDDIGRACVARSVAREMFADRAQKQRDAADREATRRAERKANDPVASMRRRIQALQARGTTGDPLLDVKGGELEEDWARAAHTRDEMNREMNSGALIYHPIRERNQ
ncbi:hypothetical protein H7J51_05335 [Mycobacterium crocinum]|uniref:Uncharacterized protein n=1 Tax=Mycolicibacterium crocinum TaxID=388459 RepID=A0ABY3TJI0_9MYCO|nr:hypothetical protein [Mycolicibacterium crocinum]MCV7214707.1 hypothetical protein [Mycolicibacterium crocinum]ULN41606.1 hypothetical protein MI149_00105 [Mycolicibacterium crocinum]